MVLRKVSVRSRVNARASPRSLSVNSVVKIQMTFSADEHKKVVALVALFARVDNQAGKSKRKKKKEYCKKTARIHAGRFYVIQNRLVIITQSIIFNQLPSHFKMSIHDRYDCFNAGQHTVPIARS